MPKSPQSTQKPATSEAAGTLSAGERAALKQRTTELKAEARRGSAQEKAAFDAEAVAVKIAQMTEPDRAIAERLHSIVCEASPELQPKLYYGQPGWAKGGKVVVFFRSGLGDKTRYSTLGFSPEAALDDVGGLWPTSYALNHLTDASAALIADLVTRAAR
ncbi:DUF1801 domain-containing protein [Subtercola boreus]|uniref:YdhG-like domain-containing protein n=1 Tax=Subtercola boreus TaxID=120213 RepID=A0A3E0W6Z3_9MICO|nr:DUF1801 domain-containing protein [Subtercola boreus]RFA18696.1 hypothetical protein B7R24_14140 [Subtercola boreus]RFA18718.1 hypothetical protein B7R23_14180 [Subtercola boreus]RFA25329.1 hypothetical protein B7R25_14245 [Subtercola boreus]